MIAMGRYSKGIGSLLVTGLLVSLAGCSGGNMFEGWFGGTDNAPKPAALVEIKPSVTVRQLWQGNAGNSANFVFSPAVYEGSVYAAGRDGQLVRYDGNTGRAAWRVDTGHKLAGGVGAGDNLVLVGTDQGDVLAYDLSGKALWQAKVSSEVLSAPQVADGIVVVRSSDGRIFGLEATDGKRKWFYQRATPALTVRSHVGVLVTRGAVFAGFAGGKLVALSLANGNVGWEATVALPRGATELERIADITSLPVADEDRVCAVAFQGRVACFDLRKGEQLWAREMSSTAGLAMDQRYLYVSDARGAVVALDKTNGSSVWKQDKLFMRRVTAPLLLGNSVVVADYQGVVHLLSQDDGAFVGRTTTDGSAVSAQPVPVDHGFLVQTRNGGLFAFAVSRP
jgi:outer membrane protein assembly factor BamB